MTTTNPFTARITQAAKEGYIGTPRTRRPQFGAGSRLAALEVDQTPGTPLEPMITEKQLAMIDGLMRERDIATEARPKFAARVVELAKPEAREALTRAAASAFISYLLELPERPRTPEDMGQHGIPAGRYAVPNHMLNANVENPNGLTFLKVDRPTEGRWAGYTFISRQAGGEFLRMNRRQQDEAKAAIREFGFEAASRLYGLELGHCGVCGRELTNETSREEGIGPVCAGKMGW